MKRSLLSDPELLEGIRLQANKNSFDSVDEVFIEGSGQISVVIKER